MTQHEIDRLEIWEAINTLKSRIEALENQTVHFPTVTAANPDIYTYPMSLSAAKASWPMLENEFDEYCAKHSVTSWGYQDSVNFYNTYVGCGADFP
jgi:hypothetical protein